ncbi:BolA family transcriptional regulator [Parashewanella spongiae]|uniref:BolA family transcriptional regulator n=1 Tax=Parashewanella spongiae TaxID=342950 RepID=A0A3A6TZ19_9GAMM|nr:BolA family protein [Parashewanella spongiae]MBE8167624.1 BolA family transcriptional regulator [Shewanella sp.]MCL1077478.1 BolA family transcriptional regulator [Parashewanella spongiae]RJY18385.1 BolA family transcriptional regulator [Parashewanella spongiae]
MECKQVEDILREKLDVEELFVSSEGTHYKIIAVADFFGELSPVKRQQAIYAPLNEHIASGALHALTIKTFTPEQWKREKIFNMPA